MAGIVLYEIVDDASQDDDDGVSHNVLPLELCQMIMLVLVIFPYYHNRQSKQTYQCTNKQPTSKTNPVSLVEGDEVSEKCLHTQSQ